MAQNKEYSSDQSSKNISSDSGSPLLYGRKNYMYVIGGVLLIFLGFALMSGGKMPSPDVWDDSIIYSFRRITLAPILIIAGLFLNGVAIFVKK